MEREIARSTRTGDSFVAAFVDVDGLKRINDEHGHSSGDEALREVGQTLRTGMRSYDVALRYGGDEFVCILPGLGVAEATARFESLQAELALASVPVSMTFGLAEWQPGEDIDTLVARADEALYQVRGERRGNDDSDRGRTDGDEHRAVAAHRMLNSSAVVNMGITTLIAHWDAMTTPDRAALLERMLSHSTSVDDRLKGITQGTVVLDTSSPAQP